MTAPDGSASVRRYLETSERNVRPSFSRCALAALLVAAPLSVRAQTLEVATDQSPVGLDPHVATAFSTVLIDSNIYEGLTAIDHDLRVVPALAASWTVSSDGMTYDFTLRAAKFHDGRAMTPDDVIKNIERVRDPKTASPIGSRFAGITSMQATGANTLRIVLSAPAAPFLVQLASLSIAAPESFAELARKPDGTGPFKFAQWVPDTFIQLDRAPDYWDAGLPKLSGLKFNIVPEATTRELGITGGTYKMLPVVDASSATTLQGKPGVRVMQTQDLAYSLVGVNASKPPFDKPEVREALNMGLDRSQITQAAYFGRAVPGGPLSPALTAWALPTSAFPCYTPDPAGARKKLQDAGLTLPVKLTLNVLGSLQIVVDVAQIVQAQLNKAGFDVTLNVQEQGKFIADWRASNFQGFVSLNGGGPDPDDYFGRTFQTGGATNVFKYSNPDLDKMLMTARAETDMAKRKDLYDQAQKIIACTSPVMALTYGTLFTALRDDVQGFEPIATRSLRYLRETHLGR
jgi:peptide/nickel transport system substrate-binding protein